jgi:hypothetical protein
MMTPTASRIASRLIANLVAIGACHPSDGFITEHAANRCADYLQMSSLPDLERSALSVEIDAARLAARAWLVSLRWLKPDHESIFGLGFDVSDFQIEALARD